MGQFFFFSPRPPPRRFMCAATPDGPEWAAWGAMGGMQRKKHCDHLLMHTRDNFFFHAANVHFFTRRSRAERPTVSIVQSAIGQN